MELQIVNSGEALNALTRAEVDIQIATAHAYPRDIEKVLRTIEQYATMDHETAEDCFYALRRRGDGDDKVIEGLSVRMAEIFAGAWGNLRCQTRITANDGRMITATGVCHDLETNVAVSVEVSRRITDKYGKPYSLDMQVVTGNAAAAIAFRNSIFKVIPKAVTKKVIDNVRQVALGKSIDLTTSRQRVVEYYAKIGVSANRLLEYLKVASIDMITVEHVHELRGLANAIKEGATTVEEAFPVKSQEAVNKASEVLDKVAAAAEQAAAAAKKGGV